MNRLTCHILAAGLALFLAVAARAQLTNFTIIDYPGSAATQCSGSNDAGDIVFTLSGDCSSFTGIWRYGSSGSTSSWSGHRVY